MKKILIVLMAALLMLTAVACKANEAPKEAVKNEEPQEAAKEETVANEPLAGGWTPAWAWTTCRWPISAARWWPGPTTCS